jgi:hypothetical protein
MNPHTPKGAPTLGVGVPVDFWIFKEWLQGSKPNGLRSSLYHFRKPLECRCLKWARMTHLDTSNTSYGQKKGEESNWQFDSRPLKVKNRPDFLTCRWCATHRWKDFDKGYNFSLDLISIEGLQAKLWAPKVMGVLAVGILGFPLGSPRTKWHLGAGPVARHKVYYKGEVVASPKSGPWWVLWVRVCPWFVRAPKCSNYALINLLFGLCKPVWVSKFLVNLCSPILELQHALLPPASAAS